MKLRASFYSVEFALFAKELITLYLCHHVGYDRLCDVVRYSSIFVNWDLFVDDHYFLVSLA